MLRIGDGAATVGTLQRESATSARVSLLDLNVLVR